MPQRYPLLIALALLAPPAAAHVGSAVAKADFIHPGKLSIPFVPEEADASFRIEWADGDVDPTGKFTFYYLDHAIPDAVTPVALESIGTIIRDTRGELGADVYVSCACDGDLGCNGGPRRCDNFIDWDTRALPDGAYWLAAVNDDPPYHLYNLSAVPILVSHNTRRPPAVIITKPDGLLTADTTYRVAFVAVGAGPFTVDLFHGKNDPAHVLGPVTAIVRALPITPAGDGTVEVPWDVSSLANGSYFVRASVHGIDGTTFTDSRYSLTVFHTARPVDAGEPNDLAERSADFALIEIPIPPSSGCGCAIGGAPLARSPLTRASAFGLGLVAALVTLRALRRGSRSGCTG